MRIASEPLLNLQSQGIHSFSHVRHTARDPDFHSRWKRDHARSKTLTSLANVSLSIEAAMASRRPFAKRDLDPIAHLVHKRIPWRRCNLNR